MKPLRIGLVHRDSPRSMEKRMVGIWSYDVVHACKCTGGLTMKTLPLQIIGELFIDDHKFHGPIVRVGSRALGDILRDAGIWIQRQSDYPFTIASESFGKVRIVIDTVPPTPEAEEYT